MNFTSDQQKAIDLGGNSLLVSAAAGSGKTAVLTERVVQKLLSDNPVMLDRLMILTFTNAAADEMKSRISDSLTARLLESPNDRVIRAQLSLLPSAQISTIHSACLAIIRENFEALGLDPRFSVGDEARLALQKSDTLYEFVEDLYEKADTDPDAKAVIEVLSRGRDDGILFDMLDSGSRFLEKLPFCEQFINDTLTMDFRADALEILKKELAPVIDGYTNLISIAHPVAAEFIGIEFDRILAVYNFIKKGDFDSAADASALVEFKNYLRYSKKLGGDPDEWKQHSALRAELKKQYQSITGRFLYAKSAQINADRQTETGFLKSFFNLCLRLNDILLQKRRSDRVVSFDDIEKYTLSLLVESFDGNTLVKTDLARSLSARYDEIIVDEYQDCNDTQDLIFRALSRDEKNIFTVGDVKQSIYRFRGAQPKLFLKKQDEFVTADKNPLVSPSKINLSCNFRSHPTVLSFVNRVFSMLMTKERAIDYSDGHGLVPSHLFDKSDASGVDVTMIVTNDSQKLVRASRIEVEARYVAGRIKQIVGNEIIYDAKKKCERLVEPRDVAILLYAPKSCGLLFERALLKEGLECQNNNPSEKYLEAPEVRSAVAFLQAIDNPYDDIPLISAMYSDCFGFDADELGTIRADNKGVPFYDAVKTHAKTDKKCADFVNMLSQLRALSLTCTVYDLICAMYEKSGMLLIAKDEKQRANLMLLSELAAAYEADSYRGLFAFINYLLKLSDLSDKLPSASLKGTDNCVNLLSIHHSKGLEYPVVFVADCGADLKHALRDEIVFDSDYGVGCNVRDSAAHREFSGIMRNIIGYRQSIAEICEDIRLLYVAMTRAQSRLYITGCMGAKEAEDMITDCIRDGENEIYKKPSYLKWIAASIINTKNAAPLYNLTDITASGSDECEAKVNVVFVDEVLDTEPVGDDEKKSVPTISKEKVKELISRTPDYNTEVPAKLSVSEIKGIKSGDGLPAADFKKPRFLQGGVTGADRGSATHKFLQFCDFESIFDKESFEKEKDRLVEYHFITKTEASLTDGEKIIEFLTSDIMKSLLKSASYYKEKRFMFTLPANELGIEGNDQIIIQGVLDCYFITDGGAVIVDYKTDRVTNERELIDRYRVQLDMYEKALFVTDGITTHKKYIYSFALSRFILL